MTTAGEYTCSVANDKPSSATSNSFTVTGMHTRYLVCVYDLPSFQVHYNRRQLASSHRKPPVSESTKHCEISDPKSITWFCKRITKVFSHVVSFCTFDEAEFLLCIHLTLRTWHGLLSYLVSSRQIKSLKCIYTFHKGNTVC